MNPSRIAGSFALVLLAAGARAQSSLPEDVVPLVSDPRIVEQSSGPSGGAPVADTVAAGEDEKARIAESNRERELQAIWTLP